MKKQLVFYFYIFPEWTEINKRFVLHLKCLKSNIQIFNTYKFILAFDDLNNESFINFYKKYIIDYLELSNKNVEFVIVQNDKKYREGIHCYNELIAKLNEYDGLVYWGHGKYDLDCDFDLISYWVSFIYFINLFSIDELEKNMLYDNKCIFGALLNYSDGDKSNMCYDGSFYWLYPQKILYKYQSNLENYKLFIDTCNEFDEYKENYDHLYSCSENWYRHILSLSDYGYTSKMPLNMYNFAIDDHWYIKPSYCPYKYKESIYLHSYSDTLFDNFKKYNESIINDL